VSLALPLVAGLLLAPILGGSWRRLGELTLRGMTLVYVALAMQLAAFPVRALPWRTPDRVAVALWLVSYVLLAVVAALNLARPGVALVGVGMLANVAAILSNGGHMPALPSALRAAGLHFTASRNSAAMASPHLGWLVDRWAAPTWVPWANVFSVGDVAIMAGGFVFGLAACGVGRSGPLRLRRLRTAGTDGSTG
jgi:hypothetical protein